MLTGLNSLTSNSMRMMEKSMEYLWAKQAAHLDNIANAETPGYKVKTVRFEDLFAQKLEAAAGYKPKSALTASGGSLLKQMDEILSGDTETRTKVHDVLESSSWRVDTDDEITRLDDNGVNLVEQNLELIRTAYQLQYTYQTISSDLGLIGKALAR